MKSVFKFLILVLAASSVTEQANAQIPAASAKYKAIVIRESRMKGGLTAPVAMFASQLQAESNFNPNARSGVGAAGIAQFMPKSYAWLQTVYPKDIQGATGYLDPQMAIRSTHKSNSIACRYRPGGCH